VVGHVLFATRKQRERGRERERERERERKEPGKGIPDDPPPVTYFLQPDPSS
jgi:hypothetical protein